MEEKNNFKNAYEREAPKDLREKSLKEAQGNVNTVRTFFEVLDLYISKFFGALVQPFVDTEATQQEAKQEPLAYGAALNPEAEDAAENVEDETEERGAHDEEDQNDEGKDDDDKTDKR